MSSRQQGGTGLVGLCQGLLQIAVVVVLVNIEGIIEGESFAGNEFPFVRGGRSAGQGGHELFLKVFIHSRH